MNITFTPQFIIINNKVVMTEGLLEISGVFFKARSGGWGNGCLPHGKYILSNIRKLPDNEKYQAYAKESFPWGVDLNPLFKTGRTGLMIHADGNVVGSRGCIAVYDKDIECFNLLSSIKEKMTLIVL